MTDRPSISFLIREWYRKYCHEKYNNIPKSVRPAALMDLFTTIKDLGYQYDDIGDANMKKIEEHCVAKKKEYKYATDSWERAALADIRNASRTVFEPEFFTKEGAEQAAQYAAGDSEEYVDNTPYKPLDRSLLKTDVVVQSTYDEEFMQLLNIPEDFRE